MAFLYQPEYFGIIVVIIQLPWWHLSVAAFTMLEWRWIIFEYKDTFPPVESTEVVLQATPTEGHPVTPWEQTLAGLHIGQ